MAIRPGSSEQRIIFWLGCHVLRHSDIIQSCVSLLRLMGADVRTAAGGKYCCGTIKDMNLTAADALGKNVSSRFNATKRDEVVSYCPSCQTHMDNFVSEANETHFNASHFVSFLHRHRDKLAPLLRKPVNRRVALHLHTGFQSSAPINAMVKDLLDLVPGIEIAGHQQRLPGMHCTTAFVGVPGMARDIRHSLELIKQEAAVDQIVTIFHSCQRQLCVHEPAAQVSIVNFVNVLAEAAGLVIGEDIYKSWKTGGSEQVARDRIGREAIEQAGNERFERFVLPELLK
jgi:hypothetical protein